MKFSNKKKIILGSIIGVLIGTLVSVSYAFFTYANTSGTTNQLITGDIYLKYGETSALGINGAMPSNTYPSASTGNYFQFQITGKNTHETGSVLYKLKLAYGDNTTDRLNKIDDKYLYFKLVEVNGNTEKIVVNDANFTTIPNSTLYVDTIPSNTTTEITKTYRLYMRIGEEVGIGTNTTYTQDAWNKLYASVKVNAEGNYITGDIASKKIISRYNGSGQDGLVAVNTNGDLYTGTGEIREYRYSGGGRYCTYQSPDGNTTYNLQVEGDTCPTNATFGGGPPSLFSNDNDVWKYQGGNVSGTTYTLISDGVQDTGLRNYITFNNEMWRIVGVFDGELKIIKDLPITTENAPSTYTNLAGTTFTIKSSTPAGTKYAPIVFNSQKTTNLSDWTTAGLMYYSNEENTGSYYNSINLTNRNMIATTTYYLGNILSYNFGTAKDAYLTERATPVECPSSVIINSHSNSCNIWNGNKATWTGKVALLYPSDFGYASSSSKWSTNSSSYWSMPNNAVVSDNWILHTDAYSNRFLSPDSGGHNSTISLFESGFISSGSDGFDSAWRPVLNLKPDTLIVSGDGSYEHPYELGVA